MLLIVLHLAPWYTPEKRAEELEELKKIKDEIEERKDQIKQHEESLKWLDARRYALENASFEED